MGDLASFNQALCGLYAAGTRRSSSRAGRTGAAGVDKLRSSDAVAGRCEAGRESRRGRGSDAAEPVVITGAALGLPGPRSVFDDDNLARMLARRAVHRRDPARVSPRDARQAHHPARQERGRRRHVRDDRRPRRRDQAGRPRRARSTSAPSSASTPTGSRRSGATTQLAIAAGIDALRDAGIPLVQHYKTTTTGTQLPDRWMLPDALRDDTGVIFASAFPGSSEFADEVDPLLDATACAASALAALEELRGCSHDGTTASCSTRSTGASHDVRAELEREPYHFDRRFLFRVLSMGHSQFAELIGARGPEHAGQRRLREHDPGRRAGRGLDPRRPLPARA